MRKTKKEINYQALGRITDMVSAAGDMAQVAMLVTTELASTLDLKGCALMLLDRGSGELQVAASCGLSRAYLNKGPLSASQSIAESISEGPVAIYQVEDDPRLQYPQMAAREGIRSILSVPLILRGKPMGVLRLYTSDPWEFSMQDITFVQAIAQILALVLDNIRCTKAYKTSIGVLKDLRAA